MKYVAVPRYERLPRVLVPRPRGEARPPKMHYGWPVNKSLLMAYAEEHDLLWGPNVGDPPSNEDEWRKIIDDPKPVEIDTVVSMQNALKAIALKISSSSSRTVRLSSAMNCEHGILVMSLYTNFDLNKVPSDAFIETLREALGQTAKPLWFLDGMEITWQPW